MKKRSILTTLYQIKGEKVNLSTILDELLLQSPKSSYNKYGSLLHSYNLGRTSQMQEKIKELNQDMLFSKVMILKEAREFYLNLYDSVKNEGLSIEKILNLYADSDMNSLYLLYEKVLDVYNRLQGEEKINFKNQLDTYCSINSGRFQPFISEQINLIDEKNIKNLQRNIYSIQEDVRKYLQASGVGIIFPDLLESEHLLLEIRKVLSNENLEDVALKYREYLTKIVLKRISGYENDEKYLEYLLQTTDIILTIEEIIFKNYKNLENPQDINFNQMVELMYFACKGELLKEITQENLNKLEMVYPIIYKLEKDYEEKYNSNIYDDLNKISLEDESDYEFYLNRVKELGFSKALYDSLLINHYNKNIDMYKLHLISKKNNKSIDLDLYNELVFSKNLKYLIDSDNRYMARWLVRGKLDWNDSMIQELKNNISNLYNDENIINSQNFSLYQSDFIVPDELILRLPSEYLIEDIKMNQKDKSFRMGILLKNIKKVKKIYEVEEGNYYLLHIDINDITQNNSKFEIQLSLLVGSEISNRIQIYRMDNYVSKGVHKNTGAIKLDTTTHIHKYNALNKVRKNKHGEMDIYKNWEDGVKNFDDGLDKFLSEIGMSGEMKEKIKLEVSSKIKTCKNMRV